MWPTSEERLFERFRRRRDAASLAKVFDRTAPALTKVALHLARDRSAAEDLVQQTFLLAIEKADQWDPARRLFPWLVGVLTNRARLARRAEQRALDERAPTPSAPEAPPAAAASSELRAAVDQAITDLGEVYRPVLTLHLLHGLNAKEIGEAIGRPAGSVRTQLVRGLERLRRALPAGLGAAVALTVAADAAVAAVRGRVLAAFVPTQTTAAAGLSATALAIGAPMTKKWLLVVPILLIGALVYWKSTAAPEGVAPGDDLRGAAAATGGLSVEPDRPDTAAADEGASPTERRAAVDPAAAMPPAGALVVDVRFADADLDASGIWVRMRPEPWSRAGRRFGARTDERGRVRFDGIPPGDWRVEAESCNLDESEVVAIEAGGEQELVLELEQAIAVAVRCVDEQGRPVERAEVWVSMDYLGRVWPMECTTRLAAHTDADGRATVPAGRESRISARKAGYAGSLAAKLDSRASSGPPLDEVVLTLGPGPGSIRGVVLDDAGAPIAGAAVFLGAGAFQERVVRDSDGRATVAPAGIYTETASDGAFSFGGLRAETYHLLAIADDLLDGTLDVEVREFEEHPVQITMRRSVPVTVRVVRPDGSPVAGVLVYGRDPQGKIVGGGSITDRHGVFTFRAPLAGYLVEVKRDPRLLAERRSEAPLDGPVELEIEVDEQLMVRGQVVDEQGNPLAGWRVAAVPDGEGDEAEMQLMRALAFTFEDTKDDGRFELWGPPTQTVQVAARSSGIGGLRDMAHERGVPAGTPDMKLVVRTGLLPRSVLTGRVVDDLGRPLPQATVRPLRADEEPVPCDGGAFRLEGLRHGKQSFQVEAPGFGTRRLEVDLQQAATDIGDFVLQPAVELRVRPVFPNDTTWLGAPPRASFKTADGKSVWPAPTPTVEGEELVISTLPPGKYELHPAYDEQIVAEPIAFELAPATPLRVDWPVRVGRRRVLQFTPAADEPVLPETMLQVTVRDAAGAVVVEQRVKPWRERWALRHAFVPGAYRVDAKTDAGHRFAHAFVVELDDAEEAIDVPIAR